MGQKKVQEKKQEEVLAEEKKIEAAAAKAKSVTSKTSSNFGVGKIYINFSYNNTTLTATDSRGNVKAWITSGSLGFSGPKKATPFAASKMVAAISEKLKKIGFNQIEVIIKGIGSARDASLKSLIGQGFSILSIKDVTPIPHNGPQPPKLRRI